jgi:hypothetical protein
MVCAHACKGFLSTFGAFEIQFVVLKDGSFQHGPTVPETHQVTLGDMAAPQAVSRFHGSQHHTHAMERFPDQQAD